jgi:hypothetical protein
MVSGLLQRSVSISDTGSLATAQWNFVMDCVTRFGAKMMFQIHACGESE